MEFRHNIIRKSKEEKLLEQKHTFNGCLLGTTLAFEPSGALGRVAWLEAFLGGFRVLVAEAGDDLCLKTGPSALLAVGAEVMFEFISGID